MNISRRFLLGAASSALVLNKKANAAWASFQAFQPQVNFQALPTGAGGNVRGGDIAASDNTFIVRCDGGMGAYLYNSSLSAWQPIMTTASMPLGVLGVNSTGQNFTNGVIDLRVAPSNTNVFYLIYLGVVYVTTNRGVSWVKCVDLSAQFNGGDANNAYASNYYGMAIDPNDPNTVLVGTPKGGLYLTTNGLSGGSSTWNVVPGVTAGTLDSGSPQIYPGIRGIAFDPSSGTTGGRTNIAYCVSFGQGTFQCTASATGTWSKLTGGPTYVEGAVVANSIYYIVGGSSSGVTGSGGASNLISCTSGGTFTTLKTDSSGNGMHTVAVNPNNLSNIIYGRIDGSLSQSSDGGATWSHSYTVGTLTSTNWLSESGSFLTAGCLLPDQITSQKFHLTSGTCVWEITALTSATAPANGTAIGYTANFAGIENLTAQWIISPPGGGVIDVALDYQVRYHASVTAYPTSYGISNLGQICGGFDADYAKDGSGYCVAFCNDTTIDESGWSSDGGQHWTKFANAPTNSGTGDAFKGGMIAMANSSSVVAWVGGTTNLIYLTSLTGSWSNSTGMSTSHWPASGYQAVGHFLCADAAQNYYFQLDQVGLYKSTNGGASFSLIDSTALEARFQGQLIAVPGIAQFLVQNPGKAEPLTASALNYRTSDGGAWGTFPNVTDVFSFGFGAAAPGFNSPSMFMAGFYNGVYGIYASKNATTTPASATWTLLTTYPFNDGDWVICITGDHNDFSKCYLALTISGFGYGQNLSY